MGECGLLPCKPGFLNIGEAEGPTSHGRLAANIATLHHDGIPQTKQTKTDRQEQQVDDNDNSYLGDCSHEMALVLGIAMAASSQAPLQAPNELTLGYKVSLLQAQFGSLGSRDSNLSTR